MEGLIYKYRQTRQHLLFVHTLYKSTSVLVNTPIVLVKLQMNEDESSPIEKHLSLQQIFKEIAPKKLFTQIWRPQSSYTPNNDKPPYLCTIWSEQIRVY